MIICCVHVTYFTIILLILSESCYSDLPLPDNPDYFEDDYGSISSDDVNTTACIIFLHGVGETGYCWSKALEDVRKEYMKLRYPSRNNKDKVYKKIINTAWFDENGEYYDGVIENIDGVKNATEYVHDVIQKELDAGIPPERIILMGLKEGAALSLRAALTYPLKLGGVVALTAWLPLRKTFSQNMVTANRDIPILQIHGKYDKSVPPEIYKDSEHILRSFTKNLDFRMYIDATHRVGDEEFKDVKKFIEKLLPPTEKHHAETTKGSV